MSATPPETSAEIEIDGEPTAVYRLYDQDGELLYVGVASKLAARFASHAAEKPWWPRVVRKTAVLYGSRGDALAAEDRAIRAESPVHNVAGRPQVRQSSEEVVHRLDRRIASVRKSLSETYTIAGNWLLRIDAYAEENGCSREAAFAVLLLTGIITYEQESKLPPEERLAAMEARIRADREAQIPA